MNLGAVNRLPLRSNLSDPYKLGFTFGVVLVAAAINHLIRPESFGPTIGAVGGLAGHWYITLRSQMRGSGYGLSLAVERSLVQIGYVRKPGAANDFRHRAKRPFRFDAQDVSMESIDGEVCIEGPAYVLRHIKRDVSRT